MGRVVCVLIVAMLASARCIAAESLYRTASDRVEKYGIVDNFAFIAPYFTRVDTTLWVSITKTPTQTNSQSSQKSDDQAGQNKPVSPSIYFAGWQQMTDLTGTKTGQIRYAVSCDLQKALKKGDRISVSGINPVGTYSGSKTVARVTDDSVFVEAEATQPDPVAPPFNGALTAISCPSADAAPSLTVTFGVTTIPKSRAYLYLSRNAFFSDSVNVGLDSNGMLSNSDSSSTQQITSILTELAQTAGLFVAPGGGAALIENISNDVKPLPDTRQRCFAALAKLVKSGPYYVNYRYHASWPRPEGFDPDIDLKFDVQPFAAAIGQESFDQSVQVDVNGKIKTIGWRDGLLAFYPVPAKATLACIVRTPGRKTDTIFLSAPSIVNLYTSSQFVDPKRDFLTGPQDTFTFSGGFIVGHKYTEQSSAKTIVDTITAPLRALVPSVSVQQNTQVQTGGGKPDQTTTTTSTTTGPPKIN